MLAVGFSEVTSTHTAGRSHRTAQRIMSAVRIPGRERIRSILRVAAQQPELQEGEDEDHREEHPRHGRGGAELEEVLEGRLVQVLDHRARSITRAALGEDEHLPEDLERADDVGDEDEEEDRTEQGQGDGPEASPPARPVESRRLVEIAWNVLQPR